MAEFNFEKLKKRFADILIKLPAVIRLFFRKLDFKRAALLMRKIFSTLLIQNFSFFSSEMNQPYNIENSENQGKLIGDINEPYFFKITAGQRDGKSLIYRLSSECVKKSVKNCRGQKINFCASLILSRSCVHNGLQLRGPSPRGAGEV